MQPSAAAMGKRPCRSRALLIAALRLHHGGWLYAPVTVGVGEHAVFVGPGEWVRMVSQPGPGRNIPSERGGPIRVARAAERERQSR